VTASVKKYITFLRLHQLPLDDDCDLSHVTQLRLQFGRIWSEQIQQNFCFEPRTHKSKDLSSVLTVSKFTMPSILSHKYSLPSRSLKVSAPRSREPERANRKRGLGREANAEPRCVSLGSSVPSEASSMSSWSQNGSGQIYESTASEWREATEQAAPIRSDSQHSRSSTTRKSMLSRTSTIATDLAVQAQQMLDDSTSSIRTALAFSISSSSAGSSRPRSMPKPSLWGTEVPKSENDHPVWGHFLDCSRTL
jgi:isochorismate synthase EntC